MYSFTVSCKHLLVIKKCGIREYKFLSLYLCTCNHLLSYRIYMIVGHLFFKIQSSKRGGSTLIGTKARSQKPDYVEQGYFDLFRICRKIFNNCNGAM